MSSGKLRTFTRGKATSLPQQSAAPESEAWHVDAPQPKAATKRFGGFSLPGRSASNGASANGSSANGSTPPAPRGATPSGEGASLSSVVDTAAANSAINGSGPAQPEKPAVRLRRLAGVASWALALVLAGAATAIVGLFRIFGESPAWFTPAFITCGVVGMLLAMMAFATVRFRGVPWMFMAASTITLLAAFMMLRVAA
jgi:hypothetical protein